MRKLFFTVIILSSFSFNVSGQSKPDLKQDKESTIIDITDKELSTNNAQTLDKIIQNINDKQKELELAQSNFQSAKMALELFQRETLDEMGFSMKTGVIYKKDSKWLVKVDENKNQKANNWFVK